MTITATPNSFSNSSVIGNGTLATVILPLVISQLSGGQTIAIAGVTPAGFNNASAVVCAAAGIPSAGCGAGPITVTSGGSCTTSAPCTQFTYLNATSGTASVNGTTSIGMNFVPGEYIQLQGVGGGVSVDNGTWRVCANQGSANIANGVQGDTHCPTAAPNSLTVSVVGTNATASPQTGAATSVVCAATCGGNIVGSIPVIDLGDPSVTNNNFAERVENLGVFCNDVPSCSGLRSLAGNEQSGASFFEVGGAQMWGLDIHNQIQQNSYAWHDLEILPKTNQHCYPGTTGFVLADNGVRNLYGWTFVGPSGGANCPNTELSTTGMYVDSNSVSIIGTGHSEKVIFGVLLGQNAPAQTVTLDRHRRPARRGSGDGDGWPLCFPGIRGLGSCGERKLPRTVEWSRIGLHVRLLLDE